MKISTIDNRPIALAGAFLIAAVAFCGCSSSSSTEPETKRPVDARPAAHDSTADKTTDSRTAAIADATAERPADLTPETEKPSVEPPTPEMNVEENLAEELMAIEEKPRNLGPPLVDDPSQLVPLSRDQPVWVDKLNKHVVLLGEVCEPGYPLEFFATYANRSYEAVVAVNVAPSIVHAGLLAVGAKPGHPARFQPRFVPPSGTEVAIEVRWKGPNGKVRSAPAQHWIRNTKTGKELDVNWVFAGSGFITDESTGKRYYQADSGELVCVLSLSTAMLDLPIRSYGAIEERIFTAFKEHLPPTGTPTTLLLKPIFDARPAAAEVAADSDQQTVPAVDKQIAAAERIALEVAQAWLDLIDRGQYSRGWETAAKRLNIMTGRREFIRTLNDTRKPYGRVKSREVSSCKYTRSIPSGPDGQYVVVEYTTVFENTPRAAEVVTLMLDGDNQWRVLGYHFK